jgi:hypothetical protein
MTNEAEHSFKCLPGVSHETLSKSYANISIGLPRPGLLCDMMSRTYFFVCFWCYWGLNFEPYTC